MYRKSFSVAVLALSALLPEFAKADVSFNVGVTTDYRYRGISQSRLEPALQGGADYTQGGFYAGAWASSIKWIKDLEGKSDVEIDVYGGYKGSINKELSYDVGLLKYVYPGSELDPSPNTTEFYGALTYGPATVKYSHAVTNTFGAPDSKNSFYLDASATFDVSGISVTPHIGHQKIKGITGDDLSYTDYSLTASKDFSGVLLSLALIGTDADKEFVVSPANGKFLGKTGLVLSAKYTF